uniref:Uncharacterized protein n=1 Tax=Rhizophora mucronata TaxID=61149 RepID=A0A2P2QD29_RHIMU
MGLLGILRTRLTIMNSLKAFQLRI